MGINNTSNTGNVALTTLGKQVAPNTPVTMPAYTAVGWTAGDYLYQSTAGVVGAPSGTTSVGGPITTLQATNVTVTGGLFNATQTLLDPNKTGATYTGPTVTAGSTIFFTEQSATTANTSGRCVALLNGNVVEAFHDNGAATPGYYYTIYDSVGNVVLATTLVFAVGNSNMNIIPVALADGGFCLGAYNSNTNQFTSKRYSSTGTLISTAAFGVGYAPGQNRCMRAIQLSNGNIVYFWRASNPYYNFAVVSSSNAFIYQTQPDTSYFYTSSTYYSFGLYPLPSTMTSGSGLQGGFGMVTFSNNYGTPVYLSANYNGGIISNGSLSNNSFSYYTQDISVLQDGTYLWVGTNGGSNLNGTKVTFDTSNGMPTSTGSTVNYSSTIAPQYEVKITPYLGSGFFVSWFWSTDNYTVRYVKSTGTTSSVSSVTTEASLVQSYSQFGYGITCSTNGSIFYSVAYAGGTVYLGAQSSQSATNGTVYTATGLYPPNYTFLGIAENTTAAGNVGNIIVGGNAVANSSMPNVSGTVPFDSTQYTTFGTKGYVTGRNFTLKGFE